MGHKGNAKTKAHDANGSKLRRTRPPAANAADAHAHLTTPTRLTGAEIIWATLVGEGVTTSSAIPGGAILPAYDALRKFPIRHVLVRHEQGAAHMADGYARASGKVGVAIATSGPGATNLVTGIATAMLDSIPIVCITGNVSSKAAGHRRVSGSGHYRHHAAGDQAQFSGEQGGGHGAGDCATRFRLRARGVPGRCWWTSQRTRSRPRRISTLKRPSRSPYRPHPMLRVDESGLAQAAELIRNSKRPVILAGHGVMESGAMEQVRTLAERAQIPVALTLLGLGGFPASHPLCLGMMGMHGEAWVNHAIQEADLLIACGMRFDDRVTGTLATYAHQGQEDSHRSRSGGDQQEREGGCGAGGRSARGAGAVAAAHCRARRRGVAQERSRPARARWRCATSRTCPTPATCTRRT